ncbi:MAG: outer membrane lipoprotein-sorting protein [Zetaproteobacteria bacterium]|nr:outer membrane lipoprotein-sorting protein [Zetaproteobacteria bacterium]
MPRYFMLIFLLMIGMVGSAVSAEESAQNIIHRILQHRLSQGFEVRMNIEVFDAENQRQQPLKVALIGRYVEQQQQLLIRGITPAKYTHQIYAAEVGKNQPPRMFRRYGVENHSVEPFNIESPLFDSGLIAYDMLMPWWYWHDQQLIGNQMVNGHDCIVIQSVEQPLLIGQEIHRVISYIDRKELFPWRIEIFNNEQQRLRTLEVQQVMRLESGALTAKALTVEQFNHQVSKIFIYSGDEHYLIQPESFSILESTPQEVQP